jgi:hypothetical protein
MKILKDPFSFLLALVCSQPLRSRNLVAECGEDGRMVTRTVVYPSRLAVAILLIAFAFLKTVFESLEDVSDVTGKLPLLPDTLSLR